MNYAVPVTLADMQECVNCKGMTDNGYLLHNDSSDRFVCADCYAQEAVDYPLAGRVVRFDRGQLQSAAAAGAQRFTAGYLLGKRTDDHTEIAVAQLLPSCKNGVVRYFNSEDLALLRQAQREQDLIVVGLYRVDPSGTPGITVLDQHNGDSLRSGLIFAVVAGEQVAVVQPTDDAVLTGVVVV